MLDWPDATQTSPDSTSVKVSVLAPVPALETRSVNGPPAGSAGSATDQRPCASAFAVVLPAARVAVTASPGAAAPPIFTGRSRWTTIGAPINGSSLSAARAAPETSAITTAVNQQFAHRNVMAPTLHPTPRR